MHVAHGVVTHLQSGTTAAARGRGFGRSTLVGIKGEVGERVRLISHGRPRIDAEFDNPAKPERGAGW